MDLLKVFKVLGDTNISICYYPCSFKNLTINDIIYGDGYYVIKLERCKVIFPEFLEFSYVEERDHYAAPFGDRNFIVRKTRKPIDFDEIIADIDKELGLDLDEEDLQVVF